MLIVSKYNFIKSPVVTEKSTILQEQGKYVFSVMKTVKKSLIQKAIEEIFQVKVKSVNIINTYRKKKRFKGNIGYRSSYKKAIVTLEKDYTIDLVVGG